MVKTTLFSSLILSDPFSGGDGVPEVAPILVEVAEDFDCTTEGVFQDPDDCSRCRQEKEFKFMMDWLQLCSSDTLLATSRLATPT